MSIAVKEAYEASKSRDGARDHGIKKWEGLIEKAKTEGLDQLFTDMIKGDTCACCQRYRSIHPHSVSEYCELCPLDHCSTFSPWASIWYLLHEYHTLRHEEESKQPFADRFIKLAQMIVDTLKDSINGESK